MRWVLGYLAGFSVLILFVTAGIIFCTFFEPFHRWQHDRLGTSDYMDATMVLLDYTRGRRDTPAIDEAFFSIPESEHLVEARQLFAALTTTRNISFFVLLIILAIMALCKCPIRFTLARSLREIFAGFMIITLILAGLMIWNFDHVFDMFHLILFDNDIWSTAERLAVLWPRELFIHAAAFIGALWVLVSALIITIASVIIRRAKDNAGFGGFL